MSPSLHSLARELVRRKVRKALAIYLGAALPALGIANLLEARYATPQIWFDRFLVLLFFGLILTGAVAWFRGKEGPQRLRKAELALYAVLLAAAALAVAVLPSGSHSLRPPRGVADKSIAVLPFKNYSDGKNDAYFSDGIMEDILTNLSRIGDLRVISRTTMMRYKESAKSVQEIGAELNVGAVLEGSVRRVGERVRIVGQLIDARTDEHLWAETYDRDLRDIFEIQSDVSRRIAHALQAVLSPRETDRLQRVPTSNIEAYRLYLRGREHYKLYSREGNESAVALFLEAISLDTLYAPAYAGLGDAYSQRVQRYGYTMDWLDSSLAQSRRALQLDEGLAEAHKSLALAYDNNGWIRRAREEYDRAISLDPNFVSAIRNIGLLDYRTGHFAQALAMARRAIFLAPDDVMGYVQAGMALQAVGEDSAAMSWYTKARILDPGHPVPLLGMGWLLLSAGDRSGAKSMRDTLLLLAPRFGPGLELSMCLDMVAGKYRSALRAYEDGGAPINSRGGFLLSAVGRKADARRFLQETIARAQRFIQSGDESPTPRFEGAASLAMLGRQAEALDWFRKAIDAGWREVRWARQDPLLSALRKSEAFLLMLEEASGAVEAERRILREGESETGNPRF